MEGQLNRNFLFAVSLSFSDQLEVKPKIQKDMSLPVRLLYRSDSLEPVTVYESESTQTVLTLTKKAKSLKLKCPIGRKPEKLNDVALPMGMKGFYCSGRSNGPLEFYFETKESIMMRITKLERKMTHLPWSNEIQVTDSFEYVHEGPKQPESPSFSRFDYAQVLQKKYGNLDGLQIVPRVFLVVPKSARTLQFRDEVGINWNEQERNSVDDQTDIVQIQLRSPLLGGMSVSFDFHYTIDADSLIKPYKSQSSPFKKLIQMSMFKMPLDLPVDYFKLTLSLPEDSGDIEYEFASVKPVKISKRSYRTYFSTTGEKEVSFEYQNMTREELEKGIAILFNYPFWGTFRKPIVAFCSLVFLIIGALYVNRMDLSLRRQKSKKQTGKTTHLKNLFEKRREILMNFEDLITGNLNTRPNSEQLKNDLILKSQLEDQLNSLQNAIFEKIKVNVPTFPDPQKCSMNSIALKRLYEDQNGLLRKILSETCDNFSDQTNSVDSICGSTGSIGKMMSQSGSGGDFLSLRRLSSNTENFEGSVKEALKIDAQVSEYESKFLISC